MDIQFQNVTHCYQEGTPFEKKALDDVTTTIKSGSYTALIGHTGSGKSTFVQHLNGLLKPTSGQVIFGDGTILSADDRKKNLRYLRQKIGLVFQFPEAQLFEETVLKDIAFGPKNFGASEEEAAQLARQAMEKVGLSDDFEQRSPLELSGGQMRRVAIAGILAMEPDVLVLDEPTAGLDPEGRKDMMTLFKSLNDEGMTIILVTHLMDDVANYCHHVLVMEDGRLIQDTTPQQLFQNSQWLREHHLSLPHATDFAMSFKERGQALAERLPLTLDELLEQIGD